MLVTASGSLPTSTARRLQLNRKIYLLPSADTAIPSKGCFPSMDARGQKGDSPFLLLLWGAWNNDPSLISILSLPMGNKTNSWRNRRSFQLTSRRLRPRCRCTKCPLVKKQATSSSFVFLESEGSLCRRRAGDIALEELPNSSSGELSCFNCWSCYD